MVEASVQDIIAWRKHHHDHRNKITLHHMWKTWISVLVLCGILLACIFPGESRIIKSNQRPLYTEEFKNESGKSRTPGKGFNVFWNSPTFQCKPTGINFEELLEEYGIISNKNDEFRGNMISILYDPGNFPGILKNKEDSDYYIRNGGVPQEGSLEEHMKVLKEQIDQLIPDKHFNGLGIIDFEVWRPVFRQNFGVLTRYKDYSYDIERKNHPIWPEFLIKKEASKRFDKSGRPYVEETIQYLKKVRPEAQWGYYAFPYCYNMNNGNKNPNCPDEVVDENNRIQWMWDVSDMLNPSVYLSKKRHNEKERLQMIKGRVFEAKRISSRTKHNPEVYPYLWYKYQDSTSEFLSHEDVENAFRHMKNADLPGVIIWGSSNDVNNSEKCHDLKKYIKTVLGPLARKYSTDGLNNIEGNEEITSNTIDRNSRDFEETKIEDNKYPNEIELIPIEKLKSELKSNNMTLSESKSNGTSASDVLKPISSIISNNNMESVNKTAESVANCTDFVVSRQDESITSSSPFV